VTQQMDHMQDVLDQTLAWSAGAWYCAGVRISGVAALSRARRAAGVPSAAKACMQHAEGQRRAAALRSDTKLCLKYLD